jgi:hypothetical protein
VLFSLRRPKFLTVSKRLTQTKKSINVVARGIFHSLFKHGRQLVIRLGWFLNVQEDNVILGWPTVVAVNGSERLVGWLDDSRHRHVGKARLQNRDIQHSDLDVVQHFHQLFHAAAKRRVFCADAERPPFQNVVDVVCSRPCHEEQYMGRRVGFAGKCVASTVIVSASN